jgi:hypothetical protein
VQDARDEEGIGWRRAGGGRGRAGTLERIGRLYAIEREIREAPEARREVTGHSEAFFRVAATLV